jgi:hypothetical protein
MASEDNISASGQFTCTSCDTKYTVSITAENETYVRSVAGLIGNCKKTDCPSWYIVTNSAFSEDAIGKGLDRLIRDLPEEKRETSSVPHTTQSQRCVWNLSPFPVHLRGISRRHLLHGQYIHRKLVPGGTQADME